MRMCGKSVAQAAISAVALNAFGRMMVSMFDCPVIMARPSVVTEALTKPRQAAGRQQQGRQAGRQAELSS